LENTIILVDKLFDLEKIKSFNNNYTIISLDISSHYNLENLGIVHEKIEDYLNEIECKKIDNFCFDLSFNKINSDSTFQFFEYDGFHLANLVGMEFLYIILEKMKYYVGLLNLLKKNTIKKIICTKSISCIIDNFNDDRTISYEIISEKEKLDLNKAIFPITLLNKTFNFTIPINLAIKSAKLIQKLYSFLFNFNFNFTRDINKNFTLILDLSLASYPDFFKNLGKHENILLIDEFVPPIWNKKNVKIAKSSNIKIIKLENFLNSKIKQKISKIDKTILSMIKNLQKNKSFTELFSFEGNFIWPIIKEDFEQLCYNKFKEAVKINELVKITFSKIKLEQIILLYSSFPQTQIIIHNADKNKITCTKIRHGLMPCTPLMEKISHFEIMKNQPNLRFALWNENDLKFWQKLGFKKENAIIIGDPNYDRLFKKESQISSSKNFILIGSTFLQFRWSLSGHDTNNSIKHKDSILEVCKISNKIQDRTPIIKIHSSTLPTYDLQSELSKINLTIPIFKTQNIIELLEKSDVVVSMDFSSLLFEAMILGKPTITYMVDSEWYESDEIIQSEYTIPVRTPKEFENALNRIIHDKNFRNNLINKAKTFVDSRLVNQGNASNILIDYLKSK
jgi:hypothetical protein